MRSIAFIFTVALVFSAAASADDGQVISLSGGKYSMTGSKAWKQKTPRVNIIEAEFAIPKQGDDAADGRLTVMASGGGVKANVERWQGQFSKTEKSSVKKEKIGALEVHIVDISGVFKDQRGPFAPATMRKDYRMMGAIIVMEDGPDYFAKLYGPKKTIEKNAKSFMEFVQSFKRK
jgi:hypothetical protein